MLFSIAEWEIQGERLLVLVSFLDPIRIKRPDRVSLKGERVFSLGSWVKGTVHYGGESRQQEYELLVTLKSLSRNYL